MSSIAVLGASGGIGQPLSLLLKASPLVSKLSLYDIVGSPGVAADLGHISSPAVVQAFLKDEIEGALKGAEVVVIPAGIPRKPGMTRDDLFNTNASIIQGLATSVGKYAPKATVLIISNPVNSTVPIAAEALKATGAFNPRKLMGVTTLDIVRAKTFLAGEFGLNPFDIHVNVVGGHSGLTIVPLISQTGLALKDEILKAITYRVQFGGDEVVKAKNGAGSATLSMAFAAAEFTQTVLKAMRGDEGLVECSYVQSPLYEKEGVPYFSSRVELGREGINKIHPLGTISKYEKELVDAALPEISKNIERGLNFVKR